jgi:hypothetical protein
MAWSVTPRQPRRGRPCVARRPMSDTGQHANCAFSRQDPLFPHSRHSRLSQTASKELAEVGRLLLGEIGSMPAVIELVLDTPTDVLCPRSQFVEAFDVGGSLAERQAQYQVH